MNQRTFLCGILLLLLSAAPLSPSRADNLIMVRVHQPLSIALANLQEAIQEQGYNVARVDMVDIGLLGMGYTSNQYRAVFFGKADEIRRLTREYPNLAPYLPPRIAVFAEGDSTLLVTIDPATYRDFLPAAKTEAIFKRWEESIRQILSRMKNR